MIDGMRRLLQRLSRGVVLRRRLPRRFGAARIFVSPDASLRYWKPTLEHIDPTLYDSVQELVRPGDVVWDVGANVGLFAFSAAHVAGPGGRVIAVEPDLFLANLLHRSQASLPAAYARVDVLPAAISDRSGIVHLNIAGGGRASNSLVAGNSQIGGIRATQTAICHTLDGLLAMDTPPPPPDVLKIDVESLEGAVLRGAGRILTDVRPRIHCEMSDNGAFDLLQSAGYTMYNAEEPQDTRKPLESYAFNTIALPE